MASFRWVATTWGAALVCDALTPHARHVFTARGLDTPHAEHGVGWAALAGYFDVPTSSHVWRLRQMHGVAAHTDAVASSGGAWPEGDLLATDRGDVALAIRTADCVPILMVDRSSGAVAAVHAGWRGTARGAAMEMLRVMHDRYGTRPADLVAAIGPSIGPEAYEVSADVIDAFAAAFPDAARRGTWWTARDSQPGKYLIDLWTATRDQLAAGGVPAEHLHLAGLCTATYPDVFHSHRRHGAAAGRMVAAIRRAP